MAVTFRLDQTSVKGVRRELLKLAFRYQTPGVTRKIIRPSAMVLAEGLRSAVPIRKSPRRASAKAGPLNKSIRILKPKSRTQRSLAVGASLGNNARYPDGYYYGFVDLGTKRSNRGGRGQRGQNIFNKGLSRSSGVAMRLMVKAIEADLKYIR